MARRSSNIPLMLLLLFTIVALLMDMSCQSSKTCTNCAGGAKPAYYNNERVREAKRMALRDKKRSAIGEKKTNNSSKKNDEQSKKPVLYPNL